MTAVKINPVQLDAEINVAQIYTMFYFFLSERFKFKGESHNFWELVYVSTGELEVIAGQKRLKVSQGNAILHMPNEFHSFIVTKERTSIFVTTFDCEYSDLFGLSGKAIELGLQERKLLASLHQEGELCFGRSLDLDASVQLKPLTNYPFAGLQLIRIYLEQLLIMLLRDNSHSHIASPRQQLLTDELGKSELMEKITRYMESHLDGSLDLQKIANEFSMSVSSLKNFFANYIGIGTIEYYQRLRINESRRLLRGGLMNITEISEYLGYSSIQTYSRQFKRIIGMSPSEYLKSIHKDPL